MKFLVEPSLPSLGVISGAFPGRGLLAVGCSFRLLTEPPARASYGGRRPKHRVGLYEEGKHLPKAVFDGLRFPVNDVAFHPTLPVIAFATGSYDGGWFFEGELVLWDWETGESGLAVTSIPEVIRVAFNAEGDKIVALVRPWDEGMVEDLPSQVDPFDVFFEVSVPFMPTFASVPTGGEGVTRQLRDQTPMSGEQVEKDQRFATLEPDFIDAISRHCATGSIRSRSPIWDIAWLDDGQIGIVHDDCQMEILNLSGEIVQSFSGDGHGCEINGGREPLVHVSTHKFAENWGENYDSTLYRLKDGVLEEIKVFFGSYTFSASSDGRILARRNKSFASAKKPSFDQVYADGRWKEINLGGYDVFNHYIRIDNSPYLFFVQDDDPDRDRLKYRDARANKWRCILKPDGSIERKWRILRDDGSDASHAMECAYALIENPESEAVVVSGKHYDPNPSTFAGFIYRKELNSGEEIWRHNTAASPTVLGYVPARDVVLAFFLDGNQMVIDAASGEVIREARFSPDGVPSVVFSCDVLGTAVALGMIDGRVAIATVDEIAV